MQQLRQCGMFPAASGPAAAAVCIHYPSAKPCAVLCSALLRPPPLCFRSQAEAARRSVSAHVAASKSDHLAVVAAYNSWRAVVEKEGRAAAHEFCARGFLADQALEVRWRGGLTALVVRLLAGC